MKEFSGETTLLNQAGYSCSPIPRKEEWALQRRWMEAFIPEVKARLGKFPPASEMFKYFESGTVHKQRDAKAEFKYSQQTDQEVALWFNDNQQPIRCTGSEPPSIAVLQTLLDSSTQYLDIAVCPLDCRWTFLITHEDYRYFGWRK